MSSRTTRSQSRFKKSPDRLSPEILLSIFLNLTSEEIVSLRRVCKKWMDVIDTNRLLWRNLEWIGKSAESIEKAVEMFDQKSASSLEVVSIEDEGASDSKGIQQVVPVISQSRENLKSLSVLTFSPSLIIGQLLELANSSPNLERLVLWSSNRVWKQSLPLSRVSDRKRAVKGSSSSRLKVLWIFSISNESTTQILRLPTQFVNSLISFGLFGTRYFQEVRTFLTKFSDTIVHLHLSITAGGPQMEQPLFCPNLKILEGDVQPSVSLYFDCPNLKHRIILFGPGSGLQGNPSSVEQLWLNSNGQYLSNDVWEPLLKLCPRMKVLKLNKPESRGDPDLQSKALIQVLERRQTMVDKGEKIQGLLVVPLQKLVLPLHQLSKDQLERARKVAREVVDVKDHPNFIELEY